MRELTTHKVNGLNEALNIDVLDAPGQGNACHEYLIWVTKGTFVERHVPNTAIRFQNGPIAEVGVNGISNEALLAIVEDRLAGFQSGPYACEENGIALDYIRLAMRALHERTKARVARGVEGTHQV